VMKLMEVLVSGHGDHDCETGNSSDLASQWTMNAVPSLSAPS
jgi:hypothetical protein